MQTTAIAQKKYQGLLWKISGNGLEKPSYLYGTMHVSNKMAFYLGAPFYDALKSVDYVALELEPELWFDEVLGGDFLSATIGQNGGLSNMYQYGDEWNPYENSFKLDTGVGLKIKKLYQQSPEMINQLLFRLYDRSGNFEEDTWLDMYIYQTAKKFNKSTLGLETFRSSMEMLAKASQAVDETSEIRNLDFSERINLQNQLEPAYRNGDLDLLDSLNKMMSTPSYNKYILTERNKTFIQSIDSIIYSKSIFAAMGAAHLPGKDGCIEILRAKGFTVEAVERGDRDAKQKKKMDKIVVKAPISTYHSPDKLTSFDTPYKSYSIDMMPGVSGFVSMDIANGLTFTIDRINTHNQLLGMTKEELIADVDKILYETIPGDIISKKKINKNGFPGFDILNRTRRGDVHHSQLVFLDNEIVLARLSGSGDKIKKGAGDYFFSALAVKQHPNQEWVERKLLDNSLSFKAPGAMIAYGLDKNSKLYGSVNMEFNDNNGNVYSVRRFKANDPDYLDEDKYELYLLSEAFKSDLDLEIKESNYTIEAGMLSLRQTYSPYRGKNVYGHYRRSALGSYVFTAYCTDPKDAEKFFNSIKINNPDYETTDDYTDSTLFYSSKVAWEHDEKGFEKLMNKMATLQFKKEKNRTDGNAFNLDKNVSSPTSTEQMYVNYYRYGRYEFYSSKDKEAYEKEIIKYATRGNDLIINKKEFIWTGSNFVSELWMSDTGTTSKYHRKQILNNHSLYMAEAIYDSILGESRFAKKFMENYTIIPDTLCATDFFVETHDILLSDLRSRDTATFNQANDNIFVANDYSDKHRYYLFKSLTDSVPPLASEDDIKNYNKQYFSTLHYDKSTENINYLTSQYHNYADSASYQVQILNNLSKMKTATAAKALKSLLMKEAPIGVYFSNRTGLFYNLEDSLELNTILFPELIELVNYTEYKRNVIHLLATMVDSNVIHKNVYASNLPYLVKEAKAELKRTGSSYQDDTHQKSSDYLSEYWSILYPHKNDPAVKSFFTASEESTRKNVIESYALFNKEKGIAVSDVICHKLLDKDKPLDNFYLLKKLDRTDLLPKDTDWETLYIEDKIKEVWFQSYDDDKKVDSVVFVSKMPDTIRTRYYTTYHYKYQKDAKWNAVVVMVKTNKMKQPDFTILRRSKELNDKSDEGKEFEKLRNKLIANNRDNNYLGSESDEYSYWEDELDYGY